MPGQELLPHLELAEKWSRVKRVVKWTEAETEQFVEGVRLYGNNFDKIQEYIGGEEKTLNDI